MPKIVVKRKAEIFKEFPIRTFQNRIKIGSEGDNDLIISDKKVSMHHLVIEKEGTNYYVTDTDSAFGTYINGKKIEDKAQLMSGDEILIGEHTLLFENILFEKGDDNSLIPIDAGDSSATETTSLPDSKENNGDSLQELGEQISEISEDKVEVQEIPYSKKNPYYLLAIYGPYLGKKYQLNFGVTKIGRDNILNDIVIRENSKSEIDTSISRRHATIWFENDEFYISDKRSKTRTYVNRELLHEDSILKLNQGDEIEIVSDQKSTIFRLVPDGLWDYSPPKKTGNWWIKYSNLLMKVLSGVIIFFLLIIFFSSWKKLSIVSQKPSPLKAVEQIWLSEDTPMEDFNQPEEIAKLMFSLTPLLGDLNGDIINDLIYVDRIGYLHTVDGANRHPLWPVNNRYRIQFPLHIVLADLNGNDLPDIVLPSNDTRIYAIDGRSGTEIWSSPLLGGDFSGAPVVADLNGDKIMDIFFCTKQGEIKVGYSTYGTPDWINHHTNSEIQCTPAAGDFDGNGIAEVAVGTENGEVFIFNGISNKFSKIIDINEELQKAKGSFFEDHQVRGHITIGKIDEDNCDDLVITTQQGNVLALSGKSFKRLWFDELVTDDLISSNLLISAALGDLDGDKRLDVVLFSYDSKIVAYRGSGQSGGEKKIYWGFTPEMYENYVAYPVIADVNKDGLDDVIAAGLYGGIYVLNGKNGKILWQHERTGNLDEAIISTPLIGDMGGDKNLDIFIRRANSKFYNITTNARVPKSTVWWGQLYNNAANTGSFQYSGLKTSKYVIKIIISLLFMIGLILANAYVIVRRKKYFET